MFSHFTQVSSTIKTDYHHILVTKIFLKVASNKNNINRITNAILQ